MGKLVLDASMAWAWLFERQDNAEIKSANETLSALSEIETFVPALWHIEITNALLVGERRHIVTEAQVMNYLNTLAELPITTDKTAPENRRELILSLAREYKLTAYDATYLDLALRIDGILATFDKKLASAMRLAGGTVWGNVDSH